MLRAEQHGTVLRQTEFTGLGPRAQRARGLRGEHDRNLVRDRQFTGDEVALFATQFLRRIDMAYRPEGYDTRLLFTRFLAIGTAYRKQALDPFAAEKTHPLRLDALHVDGTSAWRLDVRFFERRCHGLVEGIASSLTVAPGHGLSVIGVDPDFVMPPGGMVGGAPQPGDGVIDSFQRPVREQRARATAMRLLVIAEKVEVNDGQAAADVDLCTYHAELAQQDGDADSRRHELELPEEVVATAEPTPEIRQRQAPLQDEQDGDAQEAVEIGHQEREQHQRIGRTQRRAPPHRRGTEVRLRGTAGEVVGVGAAALEQRRVASAGVQGLYARRSVRFVHAHDATRFMVPEGERRDGALDAVEELGLDRGRRCRQARIVRMDLVVFAPDQPPQERQFAAIQGTLELRLREPVDLDHDQPRARRRALGFWQPQQACQPDTATEHAAQASERAFDPAKHGLVRVARARWR